MVSVRGLTKVYGSKTVLDGIELEVAQGEVLAIMGSSGGGKTTLLRCLTGLTEPTAGTVEVAGVDVVRQPEEARAKMGLVFQSAALFDYLNVRENVLFGVRRHGKRSESELNALVEELLATVGLQGSDKLMPAELSGGMRKRVGVARALALRPEVMLYDEPITGLDPVTAYLIDRLILQVNDRYHVTSIVVSHDVSSVVRVADRVAFLDGGKLAFLGGAEEFLKSAYPAIAELVQKSQARTLEEAD